MAITLRCKRCQKTEAFTGAGEDELVAKMAAAGWTPGSEYIGPDAIAGVCPECTAATKDDARLEDPGSPFFGPLPFRNVRYRGERTAKGCVVYAIGDGVERRLARSFEIDWGYAGSAPTMLARSILIDFIGFDPAWPVVDAFKCGVVAKLEHDAWTLSPEQLRAALRDIGQRIGVSCLRCLDAGELEAGVSCPVCRAVGAADEQLRAEHAEEVARNGRVIDGN